MSLSYNTDFYKQICAQSELDFEKYELFIRQLVNAGFIPNGGFISDALIALIGIYATAIENGYTIYQTKNYLDNGYMLNSKFNWVKEKK